MEKVGYTPQVEQYLNDLVDILYKKEYFSYMENSIEYVQNIKDNIEKYIGVIKHKPTPKKLLKYGEYYASFPANKRTTWYVFFNKNKGRYAVKYIVNNHVFKASLLRSLR